MGYLRWYTLAMMIPYEITIAMVTLGLWEPGVKVAVRITLIIAVMLGFNFLPERAFKRSELIFTGLKLILTIGLFIFSAFLFATGPPGSRGFDHWRNPGAMIPQITGDHLGRFVGVVQCLLYSAIAFVLLPELVVHQAEQKELSPDASIVSVSRRNSLLVFGLYLLSALGMGVAWPYDDPLLTNDGYGVGYSPYILAVRNAGIRFLPIIATSAILISSVASGRSFLYLSSRTLHSLAENGHAPSMFYERNRFGVPHASVLGSGIFAAIAYLSALHSCTVVANWLMPVITTGGYLSWVSTGILQLRIRQAVKGQALHPVSWSDWQPLSAYGGIISGIALSLVNGLNASNPARFKISNLLPAYIGIPVFLGLYYGHQAISSDKPGESRSDGSSMEQREIERAGPPRIEINWLGRARSNLGTADDSDV